LRKGCYNAAAIAPNTGTLGHGDALTTGGKFVQALVHVTCCLGKLMYAKHKF